MDRRVAGAVFPLFFIVIAILMAYDINDMQRTINQRQANTSRFDSAELAQLQLWKVGTLFAGGILATATALIFIRAPRS